MFLRIFLCLCLCALAAPAAAQLPVPGPAGVANDPFFGTCTRTDQWTFERVSAGHLRLTGQVQVDCPQMSFFADVIDIYTEPELRLVASGNVVFTNPEGRIAAEKVEFNIAKGTGTFYIASGLLSLGTQVDRAQFAGQDPEVYFYGETIEKLDQQKYRLTRGGFTTCVQPTPRWEVTSGSVVLTMGDYAVARNTILRVKGVPLLYMPLLYYPIKDDDRATGFLLPTYGSSSLRGQTISNAFFWAIGDSQDATFVHDWFTKVGQGAGAEYRYVASQGSYGNFKFYRLDQQESEFRIGGRVARLPAQSSYQFNGAGNHMIGQAVRLHQRVDYSTSILTQQLYQQSLYQASNATRTIEGGVLANLGPLTASGLFQRTETFTGVDSSQLYGSTPRLSASIAPQRLFGLPVYASMNNEFSHLPYRQISNGRVTNDLTLNRFDVLPSVRAALSRLTFLTVNTSAAYRTTYYSRSADRAGKPITEPLVRQYLTLRSDVIGPVFSKIWDTPESGFSERMKHLIEPTYAFEYVPAIDNAAQVLRLADASDIIYGDTARFTYGVNNRILYRTRTADGTGSTVQMLTVGVQQTYYMTPQSSLNDTQYVSTGFRPRSVDLSDVALTVKMTPTANFDSTTRFEYDVHGEGLHVMSQVATARVGTSSTMINYSRYQKRPTVKPESSLSWGSNLDLLNGRARGAYSLTWDIGRAGIMNQSVGFSYLAQCCGIQAEFQKWKFPQSRADFPIPSDRRFNVSFVLAGVGTFSNFLGAFGGLMGAQ